MGALEEKLEKVRIGDGSPIIFGIDREVGSCFDDLEKGSWCMECSREDYPPSFVNADFLLAGRDDVIPVVSDCLEYLGASDGTDIAFAIDDEDTVRERKKGA